MLLSPPPGWPVVTHGQYNIYVLELIKFGQSVLVAVSFFNDRS